MILDSLGDRMKKYEDITRISLTQRMPCIVRIDGRAFHSFTRGFDKPFDADLLLAMIDTTKQLCANIQGCKGGYTQSDEISLLLTDYETYDSAAWFDKTVQKVVSVSASMATAYFNDAFTAICSESGKSHKIRKSAMFDSRTFVLPKEEVCNYFVWRQQDATKNSIQMVARANFSHGKLQGKNGNQLQELLFQEKGINFNDLPVNQKRGTFVYRETYDKDGVPRSRWTADVNMPILTQDRNYIDHLVYIEEEDGKDSTASA